MSIEGRKNLEALRDSIKAFIGTKPHTLFVSNTQSDLSVVEERILDDDIEKESDALRFAELKGQRKVLRANITLFEDAVATLEDRIQTLLDEENETLHSQKQ